MFSRAYGYILRHPATRKYYWGPYLHRSRYERVLRSLLRQCRSKETIVLELGCGLGVYAESLEEAGCRCHYVGCDVDTTLLRSAYRGHSTCYVECDIQLLPFKERSVGLVLCSEVLEHLHRPYETLTDMSGVTQQAIVITFPVERLLSMLGDRHPQHASQIESERVAYLLASLGFDLTQSPQICASFIPSGVLEFLQIPRNSFTETGATIIERILERTVPSSLMPHRTVLIEGQRTSRASLHQLPQAVL